MDHDIQGYIDEHKVSNRFMQRSYCYIAKATSGRDNLSLSDNELELGMRMRWMNMKFSLDHCTDYSDRFMLLRDLSILEHAVPLIQGGGI
ncbi:hypothetical protein [Cohnella sp. GCM10027633]|uniref:hypothetical protein n=1 Tax=unclassified Cohnella TaxID=2636738 RepID=UPI003625D1DC